MNEIGNEILTFGLNVVTLQEIRRQVQIYKKNYTFFFSSGTHKQNWTEFEPINGKTLESDDLKESLGISHAPTEDKEEFYDLLNKICYHMTCY